MRKSLFMLFTLFSFNLLAQQDDSLFTRKFGLGVTFGKDFTFLNNDELVTYPVTFGNIYLPIDFSPIFRIEPEIGYYRIKNKRGSFESTTSNLRIGIGLFFIQRYKKSIIQIGGRAGLIKNSYSSKSSYPDNNSDRTKEDYYFGLTSGGEYLFTNHLSLGGEAQLNYIKFDNYDDNDDSSIYIISTRALVILRFYF